MTTCPLCEIAAGNSSTPIRLETDYFVCFPPLVQEVPGHTVIASKLHYPTLLDLPPHIGASFVATCQELARHFQRDVGPSAFNLLSANGTNAQQSVMHFHAHFLPRHANDGIDAWPLLTPHAK